MTEQMPGEPGDDFGWSPDSCALRPAQPRVPYRRTARLIDSVMLPGAGVSAG
jgi:hypothetical protein